MNFIKKILAFSLATAGALFAETVDLFYDYVGSSCISKQLDLHSTKCYDQSGTPLASKL